LCIISSSDRKLLALAADIAAVQHQIDDVSDEIKTCSSKKVKYQLLEKEHQLREEKHQLREKERLLLQVKISNGRKDAEIHRDEQKNEADGVDIYS